MTSNSKALVGAAVCLVFVVFKVPTLQHEAWAYALLLFAALVIVPLALDLFVELNDARDASRTLGWARDVQLPAAGLLAIAYWLPSSLGAGLLALPWLAFTI